HIYDLIATVVATPCDNAGRAGLHAARLEAIKQDIARNLDRSDLSVALLASRYSCTTRSVQRLFEADGVTLTEYILKQRLLRAYPRLTDPRHAREKVSTIAFDSGFADLSHFNRAFRRRFGDTPSGVRTAATSRTTQ